MEKEFQLFAFTIAICFCIISPNVATNLNISIDPCDRQGDHRCPNSDKCIYEWRICDGHKDCPGGEDEEFPCWPCTDVSFTCDDGQCVPTFDRCDFFAECKDKSDEVGCPPGPPCKDEQFRCGNTRCIPETWVCDGHADCDTDEVGCPCLGFECADKTCLPDDRVCDGWATCEEELGCPCKGFQCVSDGECLAERWHCDGSLDCVDWTDESTCVCEEGQTNCGKCVLDYFFCDYVVDCPDGSDEGEHCNYTMTKNELSSRRTLFEHKLPKHLR